jgi:hypothetical protein
MQCDESKVTNCVKKFVAAAYEEAEVCKILLKLYFQNKNSFLQAFADLEYHQVITILFWTIL